MVQRIYPSVMAKSQKELNSLFKKLQGMGQLHLDVADGRFVPSTSLWFPFKLSREFVYNAHLMIKKPLFWTKMHGKKVDTIIFHPEPLLMKEVKETIDFARSKGKKVGLALKPETKVSDIKRYLPNLDVLLILTVHPGFYGAKYLKRPLRKIVQIKKLNPKVKVIVDGHMNPDTIKDALAAGADFFVSGSFLSKAKDVKKARRELRRSLK
jgi:ribulose-phosphate 3-epimerase